MRKSSLLFSLVLVVMLLLSACAGAAPAQSGVTDTGDTGATDTSAAAADAGAADAVDLSEIDTAGLNTDVSGTFSFWNGFTASDRPVMEENVAVFDELYSNVTVNMDIQPWDSLLPKLLPSLRTGSDPDVVSLDGSLIPQYVTAESLLPVGELWGSDGLNPDNFSEGVLQGMTVNGNRYGAPIIYYTTLLYMNNDLFTEAGLPAACPNTWDEWENALLTLTIDENGDGTPEQYGMSWGDHGAVSIWPSLVWSGGGDFVNEDATESRLDDPATIAAVQKWGDLIAQDNILALGLSGVEADNLFQTSKAAMTVSGPWVSTGFTDAGINFQICPMPEGPAGRYTQGAGVYFVVNKNSQAPDAVYELLKFWQSDWAQINWSSKTGFAPTRSDLANNPEIQGNPNVKAFADSLPDARTYLGGVVEYSKINDEIITPAILEVARGNMTAEESLTAAATKMNEVLAEQ
ncbi:MAG: ABC transporter substrate-binding protein [Caldilineaceae bacterium]|nr:ABC transporter substrate-binding protein [Caldilineaceae bacterium]